MSEDLVSAAGRNGGAAAAADAPALSRSGQAQRRFTAVQWLRAFAALLVVAEHTKNEIAVRYLGTGPGDPILALFPFPAGVDVFFVISGFVMAYSSTSLYGQPGAWWRFLVRRLARIVPLYWLTTTMLVALFALVGRSAWQATTFGDVLASLFFLPVARLHGEGFPVLVVGWTLNYEMLFYALFALCIGLPARSALVLVSMLLMLLVAGGTFAAPLSLPFSFWTQPIVLEFLAGIALFGLHVRGIRLSQGIRVLLFAAGLAFLAAEPIGSAFGWSRLVAWGIPAVLMVAAAVLGAGGSHPRFSTRMAELAGNLSYGIYLLHLLVLVTVRYAVEAFLPRTDWVWFAVLPAAVLAGTVICAFLFFETVERPFLALAKRATGVRLTEGPGAPPGP